MGKACSFFIVANPNKLVFVRCVLMMGCINLCLLYSIRQQKMMNVFFLSAVPVGHRNRENTRNPAVTCCGRPGMDLAIGPCCSFSRGDANNGMCGDIGFLPARGAGRKCGQNFFRRM